jgi:Uma2 family endonuclease
MASVPPPAVPRLNGYPTSDGKPMAETDWHRELMFDLIHALARYYADQPRVYVAGNLLVFYEKGNRRKHLSPDVFVVKGVEKRQRENYLIWEEGHAPQVVIELTSSSTRTEDTEKKYALYQDTLKVREYFLFDPDGDYLDPPLQGHRLHQGAYRRIRPVNGRLPSQVTGLHLERDGRALRLWSPQTGAWLPTPEERADSAEERADSAEEERDAAREERDEVRGELEELRRRYEELLNQRKRGGNGQA